MSELNQKFCGFSTIYLITVTYFPPQGEMFDDRRDVKRFVFYDEREYIKKRMYLYDDPNIQNMYCVETEIKSSLYES